MTEEINLPENNKVVEGEFTCRVCGKPFTELIIHLHKDENNLLIERPRAISMGTSDIKEDHLKEYEEIDKSVWNALKENKKYADKRCFCGGKISCIQDSEGWSCWCEKCGFLWQED